MRYVALSSLPRISFVTLLLAFALAPGRALAGTTSLENPGAYLTHPIKCNAGPQPACSALPNLPPGCTQYHCLVVIRTLQVACDPNSVRNCAVNAHGTIGSGQLQISEIRSIALGGIGDQCLGDDAAALGPAPSVVDNRLSAILFQGSGSFAGESARYFVLGCDNDDSDEADTLRVDILPASGKSYTLYLSCTCLEVVRVQ